MHSILFVSFKLYASYLIDVPSLYPFYHHVSPLLHVLSFFSVLILLLNLRSTHSYDGFFQNTCHVLATFYQTILQYRQIMSVSSNSIPIHQIRTYSVSVLISVSHSPCAAACDTGIVIRKTSGGFICSVHNNSFQHCICDFFYIILLQNICQVWGDIQ